jgi:hypothetical protein
MTETERPDDDKAYNENLRKFLAEFDPEMLFADGYDHCIVGTTYTPGLGTRVVYDTNLIIEDLISDGASWEEAEEHFSFNIEGAYVGKHTPVFVRKLPEDI